MPPTLIGLKKLSLPPFSNILLLPFIYSGPVIKGRNNLLELDPNNTKCTCGPSFYDDYIVRGDDCIDPTEDPEEDDITGFQWTVRRPAFNTCKNNCPGGKKNFYFGSKIIYGS